MTRIGLKVEQNKDGTVRIYQPPGESNALGRIRFNFPNKFLVYQHDTPDKKLFALDKRAFSHGCMRVQDPAKYAEVLLNIEFPNDKYTEAKVRSMYGSQEITINFPKKLPVHLTYQTAYVDESGSLVFKDDVGHAAAEELAEQLLKMGTDRVVGLLEQLPAVGVDALDDLVQGGLGLGEVVALLL